MVYSDWTSFGLTVSPYFQIITINEKCRKSRLNFRREVLTIEVDAEEEKDGKTASSEAQQKASDGDVQAEKSLNLSAIPSFLQVCCTWRVTSYMQPSEINRWYANEICFCFRLALSMTQDMFIVEYTYRTIFLIYDLQSSNKSFRISSG